MRKRSNLTHFPLTKKQQRSVGRARRCLTHRFKDILLPFYSGKVTIGQKHAHSYHVLYKAPDIFAKVISIVKCIGL